MLGHVIDAITETTPEELEAYAAQIAAETVAEVHEAVSLRPYSLNLQIQMAAELATRKALGLETTHFDERGEQ